MAAQVGVTDMSLYFSLIRLSRWQHKIEHIKYIILVNLDHPDGSTNWNLIYYYILVKFVSPDGSTYWGFKYYNILVNFDHPDGSTS